MIRCVFIVFLLFQIEIAISQNDSSSTVLGEVIIESELNKQSSKINTQNIDSLVINSYSNNNISRLLQEQTNITIKSYGVNGLSTVSMRGGNANHTAVLWNGFNLQDPLNGAYNFALSPVGIIDEIDVKYGGTSAIYGSGAIGGTILLMNKPQFNSKTALTASYNVGSFGKKDVFGKISYGGKRFYTTFKIYNNVIENDFEFVNIAKQDSPIETLKNSKINQYGFTQENYFKINNYQNISSQFWFHKSYKEIPQNMISTGGVATQSDENYRLSLNWNKQGEKFNYEARSGFFYSWMHYIKPDILVDAIHTSFRNVCEAIGTYKGLKNNKLSIGINNDYTVAESANYSGNPNLNKTAVYFLYKNEMVKKLSVHLNLRTEIISNKTMPLTYGISAEYNVIKAFYLTTNISKNYKTPNFNDLYWFGSMAKGNPDLQNENGISSDIGLTYKIKNAKTKIKANVTAYQNTINNMIQWIPIDGYWTAVNQKQVETKGVEFLFNSKTKIMKDLCLVLNANYTYTDAQLKEKADNESLDILNKQIVYIPYYQANGLVGIVYKKLSITTNVDYVGQRFTSTDNEDWLDSYVTTNLSMQYKIKYKKNYIDITAKANNIFNTNYMLMEWYPMPQVNYEIGIKIFIN
jgi:iron complex outermembrane receptor protein